MTTGLGSDNDEVSDEPRLHPLLTARWSPITFDPAHESTEADVASLLEAARWAPSAGNSQPWSFIVGRRGDDDRFRPSARRAGPARPALGR